MGSICVPLVSCQFLFGSIERDFGGGADSSVSGTAGPFCSGTAEDR